MLPLAAFSRFAGQNNLFSPESKIIAAVSGGIDSVLMAHLLKAGNYQFAIAHCNFQLRGEEAIRDQTFCRQLAANLDVPFYTINFDTAAYAQSNKLSIQMAARNLRYQWFEQLRQQYNYDVIALAHHQNDTIETILLNLTRGTGIAGLHGIQPRNGRLARPLLFLTREEIIQIAQENNIQYVEDSSNASAKYARNKIRLEVIPKLKELNPNLENTFKDHLQHFNELEELYEIKLDEAREKLFTYDKGEIYLPIDQVKELKPLHLLLEGLLKPFGFNKTTITDLIEALDKHAGRKFEAPRWILVVDRTRIIISPVAQNVPSQVVIREEDNQVVFGKFGIAITYATQPYKIDRNAYIGAVDADKLVYPLTLRNWHPGDYLYPLGMDTRKKLSDFFIAQKVPLHTKSEIPLLVNGNGDIIWIAGYRLDNRYKITPGTKKISIFELTEF